MPDGEKGPKKEKESAQTFEQALTKLEEVVELLESGKLGLEKGLEEFEKGVKLYKECKDLMDKAEKKITVLTENLKENDYL